MAEAPPTNQYEPKAVFQGISGEEALRSIAISLKRIANVMEQTTAYGETGVSALEGIANRMSQNR